MVLEATMIVVDNSESSRNGDYMPSRWEAQADAVNRIFLAKTRANPESSVGLMSMGGKGPEMLVTLTTDFGKVLDGMHRTKIRGHMHLATGIQIAGLALKHRQNKSQRQRIIIFTCSPILEDKAQLVKLAKKMKKTNVSVDFVAFGDLDQENVNKLEAFNEAVKSGEGSHLAVIQPGPALLSEKLERTPIIGADGGGAQAGGAAGAEDEGIPGTDGDVSGGAFEFGVDPTADPELALALRMSMEEERARQEKESKAKEEAAKKASLEGIPEEGQPLLDKDGEPSGSGSGEAGGASGGGGEGKEEEEQRKNEAGEDADKMDTA